jgi:outer membrane protein OmpA-like peptidoglycan-associated protein
VQIPANALDPGTEVIFWRLLNDNVAKSKINNSNSYLVNLAITWSIGDDVTTAKTVQIAKEPIVLTVTNGSIKTGATAWQIIGDNVRVIGTAAQDGVLSLSFTEDPVIAAANVANPPVFGAATPTADGFTVSITNYDEAYVWETPTVSVGTVAITSTVGSNRLLTVTGLTIGQSATISQTNSLSGVANSSRTSTVTGNAIAGTALNPVFGTATATAEGFTISITNYDAAYTWATPTVSSGTVTVTSTAGSNRLLTVTGLPSGGSATITQSTSRTGYSGGSRTATGTAITATPVVVQQPVVPAPVEPAPVIQGPPPSTLKITSRPKISRDSENLFCQAGKFLFLREGRVEETAKLSTQVFSLLQNGKVVDSSKSTNDKVAFAVKSSYLDTTLSCQIEAEQENLVVSGQSLDFEIMSKLSKIKNLAITSADEKYYSDREAAYAKKAQSFAELGKIKDAALAAAKSSKEIVTARITYQKAYTAASKLWRNELANASTNRVLAKELAQREYLVALEVAGISIYPKAEKAVVTPTPTPTPTAKPTPTPSPIATNIQPTAEMKKVGTVFMATGSYVLNASTKITLKALALQINAQQIKQVLVYGHTDSRGGVNNTTLSQNRAKAVANYLRPLLKGKKIVIGWYASRKPLSTGTTSADLAKNRRVEIYTK